MSLGDHSFRLIMLESKLRNVQIVDTENKKVNEWLSLFAFSSPMVLYYSSIKRKNYNISMKISVKYIKNVKANKPLIIWHLCKPGHGPIRVRAEKSQPLISMCMADNRPIANPSGWFRVQARLTVESGSGSGLGSGPVGPNFFEKLTKKGLHLYSSIYINCIHTIFWYRGIKTHVVHLPLRVTLLNYSHLFSSLWMFS